eukprot:FR734743.1.p1 GENE.FR734743.1~~FR734743.1.p1  ORF type:complete len:307 (+),score=34.11 FR734743.1:47-967(+)
MGPTSLTLRLYLETLYPHTNSAGQMHGIGTITFDNDETWKGVFDFDEPHGIGLYKFSDGRAPRECIYRHSRRVCWVDDLTPGTRIRLRGPQHRRFPVATIINDTRKQARFRVKLDMGGYATLDLRTEDFEVMQCQPKIACLDKYVRRSPLDVESRYDYKKDQQNKARSRSDYTENFYHDVIKFQNIQKRKQDMSDTERTKSQAMRMKALMEASKVQKKIEADTSAALEVERQKKEQEGAEAAAYEAEGCCTKLALEAKRKAQENSITKDDGKISISFLYGGLLPFSAQLASRAPTSAWVSYLSGNS